MSVMAECKEILQFCKALVTLDDSEKVLFRYFNINPEHFVPL